MIPRQRLFPLLLLFLFVVSILFLLRFFFGISKEFDFRAGVGLDCVENVLVFLLVHAIGRRSWERSARENRYRASDS